MAILLSADTFTVGVVKIRLSLKNLGHDPEFSQSRPFTCLNIAMRGAFCANAVRIARLQPAYNAASFCGRDFSKRPLWTLEDHVSIRDANSSYLRFRGHSQSVKSFFV